MSDPTTNPEGTPPGNEPQLGPDGKPLVPTTPEAKPTNEPEIKVELEEPPAVPGLADTPISYDPTGNTALDLALEFVGNLGFGPDHAAMTAAGGGDFGPLREAMGKLGDKAKGWERFIKLGEEAYSSQAEASKAATAKANAAIAEAVGGKEVWEQVRTWASENATPEEKAEVNAAFKLGGRVAIQMAQALHQAWAKKATRDPAKAKTEATSSNAGAGEVVTAAIYQKELASLNRKYRGDLEGAGFKEYEALQHKRIAAMKAGK